MDDDTDMTAEEFLATQEDSVPVRLVASRDHFRLENCTIKGAVAVHVTGPHAVIKDCTLIR